MFHMPSLYILLLPHYSFYYPVMVYKVKHAAVIQNILFVYGNSCIICIVNV